MRICSAAFGVRVISSFNFGLFNVVVSAIGLLFFSAIKTFQAQASRPQTSSTDSTAGPIQLPPSREKPPAPSFLLIPQRGGGDGPRGSTAQGGALWPSRRPPPPTPFR